MKLAILTDSVRGQSTGIGFYTRDVVAEILRNNKYFEYKYIDYLQTSYNIDNLLKINNPFKYFKTYLWHNIIPLSLVNYNFDYILNFSAVPHLFPFRQKEIFFVYDISWFLYPQYHPKSRVLFYKMLFRHCLLHSYMIVVDSISTKKDLVKIFSTDEKKIHVIYPPYVDSIIAVSHISVDITFPYILFIGTIEPRKNILLIINAYKKLKEKEKIHQKLVLCGKKGWLYDSIFKLIKDLHLEDDVKYFGYITDEEKKYLYQHADFFVFPSFYEGFGIPVLEAMTYGCPVITSNISSLPEVAGNAGILIDPNNETELVDAMRRFIKDPQLRHKMSKRGLEQVKKISNKTQIKDFLTSLVNAL